MFLIDSVYIHNGGGLVLLKNLVDFLNSQYRVLLIQSKFVLPDNTLSIEKIEKEIKVIKAKLNMKFRALQKLQMEEI